MLHTEMRGASAGSRSQTWLLARCAVVLLAAATPLVSSASAAVPQSDFIVVLRPGHNDVAATASELSSSVGGEVDDVYEHAVKGFVVTATDAVAAALARDPNVAYVERDRAVTIDAQSTPTGVRRMFASSNPSLFIDGFDDIRVDADVAVIDTGIDIQHPDLNVVGGVNCLPATGCVPGGDDDNYHGTHVAGTIGAIDNNVGVVGVAPGVRLWAVKVMDNTGVGSLSSIISGLDWVTANAATIEVANMSFGAPGFSQALFDATQSAVNAGVAIAVAAGNSHVSAAGISPASFSNVLTVSALADFDGAPGGVGTPTCATDQDDTLADFSNFGPVDITAPGLCITSTVPVELGSYGVLSGTSMASPAVAGALALLARVSNPANAAQVRGLYDQVIASGNFNWTDDSGDGVKEPLLDLSNPAVFATAAQPPCVTLSSTGLIGSWRGENNLVAQVGPALAGSATFSSSLVGQGFTFAQTDKLTIDQFPTVATAMSVEMWIRPLNTGAHQVLASRWSFPSADDAARSFELALSPSAELMWSTDETSLRRPDELRVGVPQVFDGNFHHVAATWDQTTIRVYFDGQPIASKASQGGALNSAATTPFRLGGTSGLGAAFTFSGVIDEPSVWSRVLSASEMAGIRAAGISGKC